MFNSSSNRKSNYLRKYTRNNFRGCVEGGGGAGTPDGFLPSGYGKIRIILVC
jgi:hypothetical protein